jgi:hypothetical protein
MEAMDELRRDKLFAFIIQRCYLVVVAVPTPESARRIFTVLNARGMDLKPTDILKADLLDRAGAVPENDLAKRWEAVESSLGRDKFVELFGHIRMIFEREKPRSALETGFAIFVPPFNGDVEPIVDVSELLARSSDVQTQFGPEAAKAVRSLGRIDNKDWLPPVLLRLWKRSPNDNVAIAKFPIDLERLAYFLFVTRADVNERISRFTAVMDEVDPRPSKMPPNVGLALKPEEQATFLDALAGPLYNKSRVCKPVLQRLDEALANVSAGYDDPTSIEHVLPQTVDPDSEWALLFPDEEVRAAWTHRLGNLVFLTKRINTRASNWDFERKKVEYFASTDGTSPFPLTQGSRPAKANLGRGWRLRSSTSWHSSLSVRYSKGMEYLEVAGPADFGTVEMPGPCEAPAVTPWT